jgi:membrane dipeptidase
MRIDRRSFLLMAGAAALLPERIAAQQNRSNPMLIVNALGGLDDPNRGPGGPLLTPRIVGDAAAAGLDVVNVTLGYVAGDGDSFAESLTDIARWDEAIAHWNSGSEGVRLVKILSAGDIERVHAAGQLGIIYGFQNAAMLGSDAARVDRFADLGVRVIQLTYNPANQLGDGSMAPDNRGVTPFGREVIERLNAKRVMVDLSHSGERTCLDAARYSRQPISINHTGCRALVDLPRNKSDAELRLVAERGGFVGIYFMPFLDPHSLATAADVVAHIGHAVNVCGEDHVGIGTDGGTTGVDDMAAYRAQMHAEVARRRAMGIGAAGENPDTLPFVEALSGPRQFERLIPLLEQAGHPAARIEKIMGLNFLAFAREVWGA